MKETTAEAIRACLISPNVCDSNLEPANVVDVVAGVSNGTRRIAAAIASVDSEGVASVTMVDAIIALAKAIDHLASVVEYRR